MYRRGKTNTGAIATTERGNAKSAYVAAVTSWKSSAKEKQATSIQQLRKTQTSKKTDGGDCKIDSTGRPGEMYVKTYLIEW